MLDQVGLSFLTSKDIDFEILPKTTDESILVIIIAELTVLNVYLPTVQKHKSDSFAVHLQFFQ